jgi:hypothetical protein
VQDNRQAQEAAAAGMIASSPGMAFGGVRAKRTPLSACVSQPLRIRISFMLPVR